MKKYKAVFLIILILFFLAGCTAGPNKLTGTAGPGGDASGFLLGIWHGCISFITFIISLFNDNVSVYEVHNNGTLYNAGFILGVLIAYGGSGKGSCKRSNRNR